MYLDLLKFKLNVLHIFKLLHEVIKLRKTLKWIQIVMRSADKYTFYADIDG